MMLTSRKILGISAWQFSTFLTRHNLRMFTDDHRAIARMMRVVHKLDLGVEIEEEDGRYFISATILDVDDSDFINMLVRHKHKLHGETHTYITKMLIVLHKLDIVEQQYS